VPARVLSRDASSWWSTVKINRGFEDGLEPDQPVLTDVDPETMNIDPAKIRVGPRTKLLLGVHLFGRPLPLHDLPDVPLLEDAAGALGARYRGRACGGLGIAGCLSFHPRKIVTTGEGGAVTTDDERIAAAARRLRNHGWRSLADGDMPAAGLNYRLSDVLAAVGLPQLRRLDELLAARARLANGYAERLRDVPVTLPEADEGDVHGWQAYVIQVERRDDVMAKLRAEGIEAQIGTFALPLLRAYRDQGLFPGAAHAFEHALALRRLHAQRLLVQERSRARRAFARVCPGRISSSRQKSWEDICSPPLAKSIRIAHRHPAWLIHFGW
jgi:dTDP-4-amino-4,6-dideoxygalactose transaminase